MSKYWQNDWAKSSSGEGFGGSFVILDNLPIVEPKISGQNRFEYPHWKDSSQEKIFCNARMRQFSAKIQIS
jgi:hypothetical protein